MEKLFMGLLFMCSFAANAHNQNLPPELNVVFSSARYAEVLNEFITRANAVPLIVGRIFVEPQNQSTVLTFPVANSLKDNWMRAKVNFIQDGPVSLEGLSEANGMLELSDKFLDISSDIATLLASDQYAKILVFVNQSRTLEHRDGQALLSGFNVESDGQIRTIKFSFDQTVVTGETSASREVYKSFVAELEVVGTGFKVRSIKLANWGKSINTF